MVEISGTRMGKNTPLDPGNGRIRFRKVSIVLLLILAGYLLLEFPLPLSTTIQIGGDEGFELGKATLCLKGYRLYTDIWNDQPPLHTFLITEMLKHISPSVLGPRLITIGFALILLSSVFMMVLRINGLLVAALAPIFIILSPGFIALSASCMLEIPALSLGVAALCILALRLPDSKYVSASGAGLLFGLSLLIKLISVILAPLILFLIWSHHRKFRNAFTAALVFGLSALFGFIMVDYLIEGGAYVAHFHQTWMSHFGGTHSYEYGSPADYPFDWRSLFRNWDLTIPAVCGVVTALALLSKSSSRRESAPSSGASKKSSARSNLDATAKHGRDARATIAGIFPVAWLLLELLVFAIHRPWWPYYYVHIAIPLCWCAALGIQFLFEKFRSKRRLLIPFGLCALCAVTWMVARVYLQVRDIRNSPQTYSSLVLNEIKRYEPSTKWMYAEKEIYSFYSGIPMPPPLAVVMLKRLWSGEMTNARIAEEMRNYKPGLILIANDSRIQPFQELLFSDYRLVYEDPDFRLYVVKAARQGRNSSSDSLMRL